RSKHAVSKMLPKQGDLVGAGTVGTRDVRKDRIGAWELIFTEQHWQEIKEDAVSPGGCTRTKVCQGLNFFLVADENFHKESAALEKLQRAHDRLLVPHDERVPLGTAIGRAKKPEQGLFSGCS